MDIDPNQVQWDSGPEKIDPGSVQWDSGAASVPEKSLAQRAVEAKGDFMRPVAEAAASLSAGALAAPVAGLVGLAGAALPGPTGQGAKWSEAVQNLVPEPSTPAGKKILGAVEAPFRMLGKVSKKAGEKTQDVTGSPLAATAVETAISALPFASSKLPLGERRASADARALLKERNALTDTAARQARKAGYALSPAQVSPGYFKGLVEGIGQKAKTAQELSLKNQGKTNSLVRQYFINKGYSLPEAVSAEDLASIRLKAGQKYEALRGAGQVTSGPEYFKDLSKIEEPFLRTAKDFPNAARRDVLAAVDGMRANTFDVGSAIDQIRVLRGKADMAFAGTDKILGETFRKLGDALENEVERHLRRTNQPQKLIDDYREARKTIAETYLAADALHPSGNFDARVFGKALESGVPLSGNLRKVGSFGASFPKAAQLPEKIGGISSPTGELSLYALGRALHGSGAMAGGAGYGMYAATGNPYLAALAALPFSRPLVRKMIASEPYQKAFVKPQSYSPSLAAILGDVQKQPLAQLLEVPAEREK